MMDGNERENYWYTVLKENGFYKENYNQRDEILKDIIRLAYDQDPVIQNDKNKICDMAVRRDKFITIEKTHSIKNVRIECGFWKGFLRSIRSWF